MESSHSVGGAITFIALFQQIKTHKSARCDILYPVELFLQNYDVTKRKQRESLLHAWNMLHCMKTSKKERKTT